MEGLGVQTPPLENNNDVGFSLEYWYEPTIENHKVTESVFIVGPSSTRQRNVIKNGVSLAGRWWSVLLTGYYFHYNIIPSIKQVDEYLDP